MAKLPPPLIEMGRSGRVVSSLLALSSGPSEPLTSCLPLDRGSCLPGPGEVMELLCGLLHVDMTTPPGCAEIRALVRGANLARMPDCLNLHTPRWGELFGAPGL